MMMIWEHSYPCVAYYFCSINTMSTLCALRASRCQRQHAKLVICYFVKPTVDRYDFGFKSAEFIIKTVRNMPTVLQTWKSLLAGNCSKRKISISLCVLYALRSLIYIKVSCTSLWCLHYSFRENTTTDRKTICVIFFNPLHWETKLQILLRELVVCWRGKKWIYMTSLLLLWLADRLEITTTLL